jgi:DNA-binding response OmpR family regulator
MAHPDAAYTETTRRHFSRLGWEVYTATSADEVRRLARRLGPAVVILATSLAGESGWLTCRKLLCGRPDLKVILVGADRSASAHEFAAFVGAARLVSAADGVAVLVEEAYEMALAVAG